MITIEDQIACVKREIAMRKRVYKKRVDSHSMDPDQAEREIATMEAVLGSLNSLAPQYSKMQLFTLRYPTVDSEVIG